jgi:RNA polymerase sigma-70 factor (ECF subfamily)
VTPHDLLQQAMARWPNFDVGHVFLARLNSHPLEATELDSFIPKDFYLACAALKGIESAVREVESLLDEQFRALGHFRLDAATRDDLKAQLLASLLTASDGPPRLQRYEGRGPLAGWLRVVATRQVLTWLRQNQRQPVADDEALLGSMESPAEGLELAHLKDRYRGACSAAFRTAITRLETRARNLLRQHYLDELSLEELAALYRVHRATVARWLAQARATLLEQTRES